MNCVDYAINYVMNSDVDDYLLKLAFENPNSGFTGNWYALVTNNTVSQGIREKVIHQTILPACNVMGGKTEFIDLTGAFKRDIGSNCIEVNVPDALTGGRHIIDVEQVYLGTMTTVPAATGVGINSNIGCGGGVLNEMMQGMIGSLSGNVNIPPTYTNIHMLGNNSFVIVGCNNGTNSLTAKCLMEYDAGLSSIHPRAYQAFSEMVLLAVKAFIFRNCRRPAQEAVIRSGVPIDEIKDDINEYRDCWQQYNEYLNTTWTKYMAYSDSQKIFDNINMTVPSRL
ncbi:hypothetical protein [Shewanella phage FishSpeaker]|nr:hypothetical protein [Shewanella phage FishSpeaker]